jgi:transcriptional regulator with XRE-family HTH domain
MQKENFGKICASLREDFYNFVEDRKWSQQDLADVVNLPARLIGQIERGEKTNLHGDLLASLADGFKLTHAERKRFFFLATDETSGELIKEDESISIILEQTLENVQNIRLPVLLHNGLYQIAGLNSAYMQVYGLTPEYLEQISDDDPTKYHVIRHIYEPDSPVRKNFGTRIEKIEMDNMILWRFLALAHRHDPQFSEIQKKLRSSIQNYGEHWSSLAGQDSSKKILNPIQSFQYKHPTLGFLRYLAISTSIYSGSRELYMSVLSPSDDQTSIVFNQLIDSKSTNFKCFEAPLRRLSALDSLNLYI